MTLIRGPSEFVRSLVGWGGGEAVGACSVGAGAASATRSAVETGDETVDEVVEGVVGPGDVLLGVVGPVVVEGIGSGVNLRDSNLGCDGISPEKLPVTSSAVATTNVADASPIRTTSSREVRRGLVSDTLSGAAAGRTALWATDGSHWE